MYSGRQQLQPVSNQAADASAEPLRALRGEQSNQWGQQRERDEQKGSATTVSHRFRAQNPIGATMPATHAAPSSRCSQGGKWRG